MSLTWKFSLALCVVVVVLSTSALQMTDDVTVLDKSPVLASPDEPPENGGSMVKGVTHAEFGPGNVFPEGGLQALNHDSEAGFDDNSTQYSHRRQGFEEVAQYLQQLTHQPQSGSGTSFSNAMMQDPQLAENELSIGAQKSFIQKAREHRLHAKKMHELLTEDRKALLNNAPFLPNKLQKLQAESQLKRLTKAAKHEKFAGLEWLKKQDAAVSKLKKLQSEQLNLQENYVQRDAEARTQWLKKIAKQHVDFDLWRASHTGPENADYMQWKQKQKLVSSQKQLDTQMEQIRTKLEGSLDRKVGDEFLNVKRQVAAAKNHTEALSVMEQIKSLAANTNYREIERTDAAQHNSNKESIDLQKKLDDDIQWYQFHTSKATVFQEGLQRKKLETNEAKIERLKGLFIAGVVREQSPPVDRTQNPPVDNKPIYSGDIEANYQKFKASNHDSHQDNQEQLSLNERVEKAKLTNHAWDTKRDAQTSALANRVNDDEAHIYHLNGLKLRIFESKAKLESMKQIKYLSTQMAALKGAEGNSTDNVEKKDNVELKAKHEAKTLDAALKVAHTQYYHAKKSAKHAHANMQELKMKAPEAAKVTKVLPSTKSLSTQ